jgi:hypothetical protein
MFVKEEGYLATDTVQDGKHCQLSMGGHHGQQSACTLDKWPHNSFASPGH